MLPPLRNLAISICILVGLNSCSATGLVDCEGHFIYNPDSFTSEQKIWIHKASSRWNTWVGHDVTFVRPGYSDICSIDVGPTQKPSAIGQTNSKTQNIIIDVVDLTKLNLLNEKWFEAVTMHEMGHAIGYSHILNGRALMAPSGTADFTELDRLECIRHNMCSTPLTSDQADILNKKEEEYETQPSNCNREGH